MGHYPDLKSDRFYKGERLKKRKSINQLFTQGKQARFFPVVLYYMPYVPENEMHYNQVLFTVPKKHFKRAVVRNKIRRRMKEAYRHTKKLLYNNNEGFPFLLAYVYISTNILSFGEVEAGIKASVQYLIDSKNQK